MGNVMVAGLVLLSADEHAIALPRSWCSLSESAFPLHDAPVNSRYSHDADAVRTTKIKGGSWSPRC